MAWLTASAAFFVLLAGGMVTSTGSGLAVPDWPLSFGTLFPRMVGGVLFEHGHRLVAGVTGLLTGGLVIWTWLKDSRRWVKGLAAAAGAGIVVQALLGGLTVLMKLPPEISIAHACLGQTVFCLLLWLAYSVSNVEGEERVSASALWKIAAFALSATFVQLVAGAVLRHTGWGLWVHIGWAFAVTGLVGYTVWSVKRGIFGDQFLNKLSSGMAGILTAQVLLGIAVYFMKWNALIFMDFHWMSLFITLHVAGGAALLGTLTLLTVRLFEHSAHGEHPLKGCLDPIVVPVGPVEP